MFDSFSFDWQQAVVDLLRIAIAFVLAVPIAWERAKHERALGLRTFPMVAMGSCGYMLVAASVAGASAEAQARVLQGLLSGIGFIGGGAIVKRGMDVRGLATAASLWNTAGIGAAVALQRLEIAVVLSLVNLVTLRLLTPLIRDERSDDDADEEQEGSSEAAER
jgi:putative Mg2+ transporter-C (MgtC) family protein